MLAAAVALALACAGCCIPCAFRRSRPSNAPPPPDAAVSMGTLPGLRGEVVACNEWLYRGGEPAGETGFASLRELGVRTVISVTPDQRERTLAAAAGIDLVELPFPPEAALPREAADRFLTAVSNARRPIYLHCGTGCHRAGALVALYRIRIEGWDYDRAVREFAAFGGDTRRDRALLESLRQAPGEGETK